MHILLFPASVRLSRRSFAWLGVLLLLGSTRLNAAPVPEDFPEFRVPGFDREMNSLRALFWLHYEPAGPLIPLWDEWMPLSTLWPARGVNAPLDAMRNRWAAALSNRPMNAEGYVLTQQHDGPAHAEGWPFPRWMEAGGVGWHFRGTGIPGYDAPPATPEGWKIIGGTGTNVNDKGWVVQLEQAGASLVSPRFSIAARQSPWLRLNWWATGLEHGNCFVEWTTEAEPEFSANRRAYFPAAGSGQQHSALPMGPARAVELNTSVGETRTMIPLYTLPQWQGVITGFRICLDNPGPAAVVIKSFHTACDTRQTINNTTFTRGCYEYFLWTKDVNFLRAQIPRMRTAIRWMMDQFETRKRKCVYTTWRGHEGRSGVRHDSAGNKTIVPGEGIGGNYWDLLPFGGEDALATIYYYDAILDLADAEQAIRMHPEWCLPRGAEAFDPADLRHHANEVRDYGRKRFWNPQTGRFGTVDLDGVMHDYGFTFLNNEAIYYDFASSAQAKSIRDWISGRRAVEGDTATGADIYHWRFGPRSTTRRNLDYYFWGWSSPESIPWGYQVQDGGAVLGFSYHDLMARLKVEGPDSAWSRLREITRWFEETQAAGGYREYYKDPARGTMQGANVAGGLGLDKEFFESILVPQVMIYGFLGFRPTPDGFSIDPKLPSAWPELKISRIHLQDQILSVSVREHTITVEGGDDRGEPLVAEIPAGWTLHSTAACKILKKDRTPPNF